MNRIGLEVPVATVEQARLAAEAGADRLELCADLDAGGVSADDDTIRAVVAASPVPVVVMARPRGGDFVYGRFEIDAMAGTIRVARMAGAAAVVFGALTKDGAIDANACRRAIEAAESVPCVFHRAFDDANDPHAALETLISLGFRRILTGGGGGGREVGESSGRGDSPRRPASGSNPPAGGSNQPAGGSRIARLMLEAAGRIEILPGGGIRADNVAALLRTAHATFIHSGCRRRNADGRYAPLDQQAIRELRAALDRHS